MNRCILISFIVYVFTGPIAGATDWSSFDKSDIYPEVDKSNCVFPFQYKGKSYTDCTVDGDNGKLPWCALTAEYQGKFTYCYDFRKTNLTCLPTYTINNRAFTGCSFLSKSAKYKQCKTNHSVNKIIYCTEEHTKRSGKRLMRTDTCDPAYLKLSPVHTMCIGPSDYAVPVPLTQEQKDALLAKHNEFRGAVPSEYMFKLYWDDELAKIAQAHSNMCGFDHDLAVNRLSPKYNWKNGQNMVVSTELATPLETLLEIMLNSEKARFSHGIGCTQGQSSCLHYTQAMLSNMTRVGCSQTDCIFPHGIERYLTCNYIHSQYQDNYKAPYAASATPATKCPTRKSGNLCDCGDKICKYDAGEYLEPETCACKSPIGKRSLNKRDVADGVELENLPKPFVAVPSVESLDLDRKKKRSLTVMSNKNRAKRDFKKIKIFDKE